MLRLDVTRLATLVDRLNQNGAGLVCGDLLCAAVVKAAGLLFSGKKLALALTVPDGEALRTTFLPDAESMAPRELVAAMRAAQNGAACENSADGLEIIDLTEQAIDGLIYTGKKCR